ncbi:hypothetical protein V3C99_017297 [Haemonchus contortus]
MPISLKELLEALPQRDPNGRVNVEVCYICGLASPTNHHLEMHLVAAVWGSYHECAECHNSTTFAGLFQHVEQKHMRGR